MNPSYYNGDLVVVTRVSESIKRGQVLLLKTAHGMLQIKRVVGLPGETVSFDEGLLYVNDRRHIEPYLHGLPANLGLESMSLRLDDKSYFVLGDNRAHSTDSRHTGPVTQDSIVGTVSWRLWPLVRRDRACGQSPSAE